MSKPTGGKVGKPPITITEETIKNMLALKAYPLTYDIEVYHYLIKKEVIDFSKMSFIKLMAGYRNEMKGDNKEERTYRKLRDIECRFCEIVDSMKEESVSVIKAVAFRGALQDGSGRVALSYLDKYDIRNKQMEQDIKKPDVEINNNLNMTGEIKPEQIIRDEVMKFFSLANKPCPLYTNKMITLLEGGRDSGKSYQTADILLHDVLVRDDTGTVICGREVQNNLAESSYALLVDRIRHYNISNLFKINNDNITCLKNNVIILFKGIKEAIKQDSLKSTHKLFFFWGEEAQKLSKKTIDVLIPTMTRVVEDKEEEDNLIDFVGEDVKVFFTMNRTLPKDPVIEKLESPAYKDLVNHLTINYYDNPYLSKATRRLAETMKATDFESWKHIYNGEPQTIFENPLWSYELLQKLPSNISYDRDNYSRVVVSCDPATTNKDFSNQYGIQVCGMTNGGEGHHISNLSGVYSPNEFATKAINAYHSHNANAIIVETNQGGDFIKNTILSIDPTVNVEEVRADKGKIERAIPVANMAQMGKIRHICGGDTRLEEEMSRMTTQGFIGQAGESPDMVDAYCWGFIDLFNLSDLSTSELFIKSDMFAKVPNEAKLLHDSISYVAFDKTQFGIITCNFYALHDKRYMEIVGYTKGDKENAHAEIENELKKRCKQMNIPEDVTGTPIIESLSKRFIAVDSLGDDNYINKKISDRVLQIIPILQSGQVCIAEIGDMVYNNERGNLFLREVTGYSPEVKKELPLLAALCNAIFREWEL